MTKEGVDKAIEIIDNTDINNDKILVVYIPDIHESLAGIVAGRIKERYNKPTIILPKSIPPVEIRTSLQIKGLPNKNLNNGKVIMTPMA